MQQSTRMRPTKQFRQATAQQCRVIDTAATDVYGIPSIVLMENASRALASVTLQILDSAPIRDNGSVLIICGAGNNGGDGYAASRHLHNAGCPVTILAMSTPRPNSDAAVNAEICRTMSLPVVSPANLGSAVKESSLVIDAIFGTGLDRDVTGDAAHVIAALNEFDRPVVAADLPSGLQADSGRMLGEAVRATATVTFAALKPGLLQASAQPYAGRLIVAGIGAPAELVKQHTVPIDEDTLASLPTPPEHVHL